MFGIPGLYKLNMYPINHDHSLQRNTLITESS